MLALQQGEMSVSPGLSVSASLDIRKFHNDGYVTVQALGKD